MNWVAIGAIGSLLSGILTPLAILIAYKTYKRDLKKSLVIFHSCSINDNNDIYNDKLYITIYNSGLRKIILTGIGFEEPVAWVAKHRLNPDRNNVNNFQNNVHFPIELQAEEHIDIVISLYQYMEWITRNIISSTLRSSRFKIYVKDGSRKFYYDKKDIIFNWNDEKIMEYYKDNYNYFDLNDMTGDFTKENPYYGLNEFKLGFKPKVYEFIGEYDLIINDKKYKNLLTNGTLAKIFNKTDLKITKENAN